MKLAALNELKKEEVQNALLITPYPLTEAQMAFFLAAFPFLQKMKIEKNYDSSLIAGFILKWDSKIIDASLRGRIDALVGRHMVN